MGIAVLVAAETGFHQWRTRHVGPVQRGLRAASARGCFACHGPGGVTGLADAGPGIGSVPPFSREEVRSYARDEAEIREWILDGAPRRLREAAGAPEGPAPLLRMPAWRGVLSDREVCDLVAYVKAVSDFDLPPEGPIDEGRRVAAKRGCLACHGPQGRGNAPNPGSLKGYIPSWDGADFPELARDEAEVREWILDGSPRRLRENPLAMFFLRRQVLQMPGYREHLSDDEVVRLLDYIRWLRRTPS
ncbi:MAG TPA: c-type cytochrome [Vicinamibacteria bacterium]